MPWAGEIDEHLEHVPAMAGIAAGRQHHLCKVPELLEIAGGQRQPARVESVQATQLVDADLRRHIGEIAFGAGEHHIDLPRRIALDAMKAVLLEELGGGLNRGR